VRLVISQLLRAAESIPFPTAILQSCASAALLIAALEVTASAAVLVAPRNLGDVLGKCDLTVVARAGASRTIRRGAILDTITSFTVERVVGAHSQTPEILDVETLGGAADEIGWSIPGSPRFAERSTYLLLLRKTRFGTFRPWALSYGLLERVRGREGLALLRPLPESRQIEMLSLPGGETFEPIGTYREEPLLSHLDAIARGEAAWAAAAVLAAPEELPEGVRVEAPPPLCAFLLANDGNPARWFDFDSAKGVSMTAQRQGDPSLPDGGFAEIQGALANWMAVSQTSLLLSFGGAVDFTLNCATGVSHNPLPPNNVIVFGDPCSDEADLADCVGLLAVGGNTYLVSTQTFDGAPWHPIAGWFVVVNKGTGCIGAVNYKRMLTHELGHGLGFAHSTDPNSVMAPVCCNDIGALDVFCVRYFYPAALSPAPSPEFSLSPIAPAPGQIVQFTDKTSGGVPTSWSWDFGDGTSSTAQNPTHAFAVEGVYRVTLTTSNAAASKSFSLPAIVAGSRPVPRRVPHPLQPSPHRSAR
jgi:hypothetical protein